MPNSPFTVVIILNELHSSQKSQATVHCMYKLIHRSAVCLICSVCINMSYLQMHSWRPVHTGGHPALVRQQDMCPQFCSGLPRLKIILKHVLPCHVLQSLGKDQGTLQGWQTYKLTHKRKDNFFCLFLSSNLMGGHRKWSWTFLESTNQQEKRKNLQFWARKIPVRYKGRLHHVNSKILEHPGQRHCGIYIIGDTQKSAE